MITVKLYLIQNPEEDMSRLTSIDLQCYIQRTENPDLGDSGIFSTLARDGRTLTGMTRYQAGVAFNVAAKDVAEWERGASAPAKGSRAAIIGFYRDVALKAAGHGIVL
jgi:hypothetical protein